MTRDTMIARVKARFGDPSAQIFDADYYCNAINEAYSAVIDVSPFWPFLETNTTGLSIAANSVAGMALPADATRVLALFNTTDLIRMEQITGRRTHLDMYPEGANQSGTPIQYRIFNNTIFVFPVPSVTTSFSLDYAVRPARLATGGASPVIPDQYQEAIIEHAIATANIDDGNMDQYNAHMAVFGQKMEQMKNDLLNPRGDSYAQINDTWSW